MSDFEVKFNTTQLLNGLPKAFHESNDLMARRVTQEVRNPKWPWPRETIRKRSGEKVDSPRNIIDETTFSQSQSNERVDETTHEHRFDTEYALAVILGATLSNGTTLPARNVFEEPLKKLPGDFSKLAKAELAKVKDPP